MRGSRPPRTPESTRHHRAAGHDCEELLRLLLLFEQGEHAWRSLTAIPGVRCFKPAGRSSTCWCFPASADVLDEAVGRLGTFLSAYRQ